MRKILTLLIAILCYTIINAQSEFITVWDTRVSNPANNQIIFPGIGNNYTIEWEQIEPGNATGSLTGNDATTIIFPEPGKYRLLVSPGGGSFTGFKTVYDYVNDPIGTQIHELIEVANWGNIAWTRLDGAFAGCVNMDLTAQDVPNLANVTSLAFLFYNCASLKAATSPINSWNTSTISNMNVTFAGASLFNQPIGNWDVSNVSIMTSMFSNALAFNQPIGNWNTSNVYAMEGMFSNAPSFNQPIGNWDVRQVTTMRSMFHDAHAFNQSLNNWELDNATDLSWMFAYASSFNQPLNNWDVSKVTDIAVMFAGSGFNQNINNWDVSNVTNFDLIFTGCSFNQPLNSWQTNSARQMWATFSDNHAFNQPLDNWKVDGVTTFEATFQNATAFNQSLKTWNIASATTVSNMLDNSGLSCLNYGATLQAWANNASTPTSLTLDAAGLNYGSIGQTARNTLINNKTWTINGDSYSADCNDAALPIAFGSIEAFVKDGTLTVNWQSLTETNNHHYEIEASADGKTFKKIGDAVLSKAKDGKSDAVIQYDFSYPIGKGLLTAMGLAALLLVGKRRKWFFQLLLLVVLCTGYFSCKKSQGDVIGASGQQKLYIRIAQVDKDGTKTYSKIVQAIIK